MSWLFKDPIVTVTCLNLDHAQSNSKKWLKKIKLPQMKFFLEKQLIKFSCTSWHLLLSEIKNTNREQIHVMGTYHFWAKMTKLPKLRKNLQHNFHVPLGPFIVQNCKAILNSGSRVVRTCHFREFSGENNEYYIHLPIDSCHCAKF